MGFFKDYKDETLEEAEALTEGALVEDEALTEEDILSIEDILDAELQSTDDNGNLTDEFDDDVDEDLLYSLLSDEVSEEPTLPEQVEFEPDAEVTAEVAETAFVEIQDEVTEEAELPRRESKSDITEEDKRAVTVITKGTTINGSIISDCSLDVMGTINGDVECYGKLSISGKVTGNTTASEVFVNTDHLRGNINSEGAVKVSLGTVVIGDISAASGVIAGAVKGEIDVEGPIVIDSTAIIKGNVKAKSIQMNNGAVLEGYCSLNHPSVDIDNIFE